MTSLDFSSQEIKVLKECLLRLKSVVLRVNGSLDLDTVLREIIEITRELTGAACGVITALGETGLVEDVVLSGFTPEQEESLFSLADGQEIYECFRHVRGVETFKAMPVYRQLESADLVSSETFFSMPLHVRDRHVGNFFLMSLAAGGAHSGKDREVLELLTTLAATAIANARAYRHEQRARSDLEAMVRTSPVGVVVFDARIGDVALLNQEAMRLTRGLQMPQHSPEQLWKELLCRRADGREIPLREFLMGEELRAAEMVRSEKIELANAEGRSVSVLLNATPIRSGDGAVVSIVATLQDLAPLRELERLRAEFTGMVSHELRTPLTSIKGATATVLGAAAPMDRAELLGFFRIIDSQADRMHGMIGDLLDAGRIDTGTLSVDARPSDVVDLVEQARSSFLAGGGSHPVLVDIAPDVPWIMADRQRIVQVLLNLFTNAARHSPDGVPMQVLASHDGIHMAVSVSDEGMGIAPELMPRLFQKHVDFGGGEKRERLGLGLAICRGLVETHGGRIRAESQGVGQGAVFTFTIPLAAKAHTTAEGRLGGTRVAPSKNGSDSARILVVDDDPHMLRYVRDTLTVAGYRPTVTGDPNEVARIISAEKPDLILLDLMLPGTTGLSLMEDLHELTDQPVVFISAYRQEETIVQALDAGAVDYIVKPFSQAELTARVRVALRRKPRPDPYVFGDFAIDYDERRVTVAARPVELTVTEYRLLRELSRRSGSTVTYETLVRRVWGSEGDAHAGLVRAAIMRLRRKLGDDPDHPTYIHNVHAVGYRMPEPSGG